MVLVVCDQTFRSIFFLGGIVDTIFLGNKMANKTMHGLSNNRMGFIIIIVHKKMLG
jgi:vacuolar-type H+-ATPase subunit F/Vma7